MLFLVDDKNKKSYFFEKTYIFANKSINVIFEIFFLILSNIEVNFND